MLNHTHKAHNEGHMPADVWFLGRLLETDSAGIVKDLGLVEDFTLPALVDLELLAFEVDLEEVDVEDLPLLYKWAFFREVYSQMLYHNAWRGTKLLCHCHNKAKKLLGILKRRYPKIKSEPFTETNPYLTVCGTKKNEK